MRRTIFAVDYQLAPSVWASSRNVRSSGTNAGSSLECSSRAESRISSSGSRKRRNAFCRTSTLIPEAPSTEIAADDPYLGHRLPLNGPGATATSQSVASRLLVLTSAEGRVIRARPKGGWTSTQFTWCTRQHLAIRLASLSNTRSRRRRDRSLMALRPRTSHRRRSGLVDWMAEGSIPNGDRWSARDRGRDTSQGVCVRSRIRSRTSVGIRTMGCAPARTRFEHHGLETTRVLPWSSRRSTLRQCRKRRVRPFGSIGRIVGGWVQRDDGERCYQAFRGCRRRGPARNRGKVARCSNSIVESSGSSHALDDGLNQTSSFAALSIGLSRRLHLK